MPLRPKVCRGFQMGSGRKMSNSVTESGNKIIFRRYLLSPCFRGYCAAVFSEEWCRLLKTWEIKAEFRYGSYKTDSSLQTDSSLSPKCLAAKPSRLMKQRVSHSERRFGRKVTGKDTSRSLETLVLFISKNFL